MDEQRMQVRLVYMPKVTTLHASGDNPARLLSVVGVHLLNQRWAFMGWLMDERRMQVGPTPQVYCVFVVDMYSG
jgi:hypothetical protein